MKVYSQNTHEIVTDYVGCWYQNQCQPQSVRIYIDGEKEDIWIDTDHMGGGVSEREFNREIISFKLPAYCYSPKEAQNIIATLDDIITELFESYEWKQMGYSSMYQGNWDENLIWKMEKAIEENHFESDLFFDETGMMEEESNEIEESK
jgi:hypothetical protein